jgi:hypothetical protein
VETKKSLQKRCKEVGMEVAPIRVTSPEWARGPARIENGEIVLDEEKADVYSFESSEDSEGMAFELAALLRQRATERNAVGFANRYGLLWHGADDLGRGECREPLQEWWIEADRLNFVGALYQAIMDSKRRRIGEARSELAASVGHRLSVSAAGKRGLRPALHRGREHLSASHG